MAQDLIIVVPGITGSVLAREGTPVWDLSVAALRDGVLHSGQILASMALPEFGIEDADPAVKGSSRGSGDSDSELEPVALIRGWHIWPGFWMGSGYGALVSRLERAAPGRVLQFPYDWRLSNSYSALRLRDRVERELRGSPGRKVALVCHSMGGLVARYYLEVLEGREHVSRLITIGTPFSGSVKAIRALTGGLMPGVRGVSFLRERLTEVARTFPSVAELLPLYRCVQIDSEDEPRALKQAHVPDLPAELVAWGRQFHDRIAAAAKTNGAPAYTVHAFAGKMQPTEQSVLIEPAGARYQRHQRGRDWAGDGTVPSFSAVPPEWTDTGRALYRAARHGPLTGHRALLEDVVDKINALELRAVLAPEVELVLNLPDVAPADRPVPVQVRSPARYLPLNAEVRDLEGTVVDSRIPLQVDDTGHNYEADLNLPAGTWHISVQEAGIGPGASIDDVVTLT